jgi:hypothetical protein
MKMSYEKIVELIKEMEIEALRKCQDESYSERRRLIEMGGNIALAVLREYVERDYL